MIGARIRSAVLGGLALLPAVALAPFWLASCANAADGEPRADAGSDSTIPVPDAGADAGCDPEEPGCVSEEIPCDEADFCPVATPVSSRFALTAVWGATANDVWAVGSGGTIIHWDGTAWVGTPTGVKNTFHGVWGSGSSDVWAISASNVILHSEGFADGKATWTPAPSATEEDWEATPLFAIWGTGPADLRVGGRNYNLYEPNGDFGPGNQFTKMTLEDGSIAWTGEKGTATVQGIWSSSPDDVWIVGDNSMWVPWQLGLTMHGTRAAKDAPLTWTEVDSQAAVVLDAIWGSSASDLWAVGDKGTIRRLASGAARWEIVESPTTEALHALWGSGPSDVWAVGDRGTILHFDGAAWAPKIAAFPVGRMPHLYGVWGSSRDDVWIVGDGVALRYTGGKK
jgi:hypothetical protein